MSVIKFRLSSRSLNIQFRLSFRLLISVMLVSTIFYIQIPPQITDNDKSPLTTRSLHQTVTPASPNPCPEVPGMDRVVITIKTGATEALARIPRQLRTSLRCVPTILIFSDMAQVIGSHQVHDALDTIPVDVTYGNIDFDIYRKQQSLDNLDLIALELRDLPDPNNPEKPAAWTLDKYKNIHIVEKAWALKPDMDWYFHIDADTYVIWSSLMAWLSRLDPTDELFLGSLAYVGAKPFAHGGSGILLSGAATRKLVIEHNGTAARWDEEIRRHCCGDLVLAQALGEMGMRMRNAWPSLQGENVDGLSFGAKSWDQPLVTMHHMSPGDMENIARFEEKREDKSYPVVYSELFEDLIFDSIPDFRENWDNGSKQPTSFKVNSAAECVEACANRPACFQSLFNGTSCRIETRSFSLGQERIPSGDETWQSSWNKTRIAQWAVVKPMYNRIVFPFRKEMPIV